MCEIMSLQASGREPQAHPLEDGYTWKLVEKCEKLDELPYRNNNYCFLARCLMFFA